MSPYELTAGIPRARFVRRFGFDPGAAAQAPPPPRARGPSYEDYLDEVGRRLAAATGRPVAILSPAREAPRVVGD